METRRLEKYGLSDRLRPPDQITRGIGQFASISLLDPDGHILSEDEWKRRKFEWLPSPDDKRYLFFDHEPADGGSQVRRDHIAAAAKCSRTSSTLVMPHLDGEQPGVEVECQEFKINTTVHDAFRDERHLQAALPIHTARDDARVDSEKPRAAWSTVDCHARLRRWRSSLRRRLGYRRGDPEHSALLLPPRERDVEPARADAKAVIAALNGHTVGGGGLEVALAADLPSRRRTRARLVLPRWRSACCQAPEERSGWRRLLGKGRHGLLISGSRLMDEALAMGLIPPEVGDKPRSPSTSTRSSSTRRPPLPTRRALRWGESNARWSPVRTRELAKVQGERERHSCSERDARVVAATGCREAECLDPSDDLMKMKEVSITLLGLIQVAGKHAD